MIDVSAPRFEILPFGDVETQAAELAKPTLLTVTASPKQGIDHTISVAERLSGMGHAAVVHLAARMIRDEGHLDELLRRMRGAGIERAFVIGGDTAKPAGPFASAGELLARLDEHPDRPREIGIGAYPEGHPLIADEVLATELRAKSARADYLVTQLCFDPGVLLDWLGRTRAAGIDLTALAGIPGPVDRRRLLDISVRVGVGASVSFLRKQRGLRRLLASPAHEAEHLRRTLGPRIGDPALGLAGFHLYTFNRLADAVAWYSRPDAAGRSWGRRPLTPK